MILCKLIIACLFYLLWPFVQTGKLDDSLDKTWIVSAQSPSQKELIEEMKPDRPLYVEGSFRVWLRDTSISYFVLRADNPAQYDDDDEDDDPLDISIIDINIYGQPQKKALTQQKELHRQKDGVILGICATGTSSRDSLLSWIRMLESTNPNMANLQVIFTLKAPTSSLQTINEAVSEKSSSSLEEEEINESNSSHEATTEAERSTTETFNNEAKEGNK